MRVVSILATDPGIAQERAQLVLEMIALPVVFGLLVLLASLRDRVVGVPTELTEPPEDLHPVDLAILWSAYRKHVSPRTAYRAEILHLARIQAIRLDPIGTVSEPEDFRLTLWRPVTGQVDRDFIHFMFPEHRSTSVVTLHELRLASGGRDRLSRWWSDAYSRVGEPVQRMWLDQRAELWAAFVLGVWAPPLALGVLTPHYQQVGGLAFATILTGWICWFAAAWALPARLSEPQRRQVAAWKAFRRHLRRYPSAANAPAAGVVIWERYLTYAVALGLGHHVERQVRGLDPEALPSPWNRAPDGVLGLTWFRSLCRWSPTHVPPVLRHSVRPLPVA